MQGKLREKKNKQIVKRTKHNLKKEEGNNQGNREGKE